jgi:hypothetical protein
MNFQGVKFHGAEVLTAAISNKIVLTKGIND